MRARILVVVLVLLAGWGAAGGRASQDPYLDAAQHIPCPAAPPGWVNPPPNDGGRFVLTPLTAETAPDGLTEYVSAPLVEVDCDYRTDAGKDLQVRVRYALPIDINPWNDFYIGCTVLHHPGSVATSAKAWNERDRVFRVVGAKTWSLATFIDDLGQLGPGDVARFEAMTRQMLAAAQPLAHDCRLAGNGGPVEIKSIWVFSFKADTTSGGLTSTGTDSGSFVTTPAPDGGPVGAITNLLADDFRLHVTGRGLNESLVLRVASPIEFRHGYGTLLKAHVVVLSSNATVCTKGTQGTLELSLQYLTNPQVSVQLCGHTYLNGKGKVTAVMKTG